MKSILITGATGNAGMAVIQSLSENQSPLNLFAGVRDMNADKKKLSNYKISLIKFDFMDSKTFDNALSDCHILFLLRPPQISDTKKYFLPLIKAAQRNMVGHIIFLSVQGVEKSTIIPHHQIEKMIVESKIPYTFLRPAYFMQNFSTTLRNDLVKRQRIFLPAGKAKFTLIDVGDIGKVAAVIMADVSKHLNKSYELTCAEKLSFKEMATQLSDGLGETINYISPSLVRFFFTKRKEKLPLSLILVMIMLHYLPRFQKEPAITDCVQAITGKQPITFEQFITANKNKLLA